MEGEGSGLEGEEITTGSSSVLAVLGATEAAGGPDEAGGLGTVIADDMGKKCGRKRLRKQ